MNRTSAVVVMVLLSVAAGLLSHTASRHNSATFDEVILVSGGIRGMYNGRWEMVTDQPPLMMYAYGLAARAAATSLPPETRPWEFDHRWTYARGLFFRLGNDPQALLVRARAVAAGVAGLLVLTVGLWAMWIAGPTAGVLGAGMAAFLPDLLAHGGVAYNDVPLALAFVLSLWSMDVWVRTPNPRTAFLAGAGLVLAFGMKLSALALLPAGAVIGAIEAWNRRGDRAWWRDMALSKVVIIPTIYVGLVLLYRGDPTLTLLRFNFFRTVLHASGGHEAPAYLLGQVSAGGWWYYFPVALALKTPVALLLALLGGTALALRHTLSLGWKGLSEWKGRAAVVGVVVFLAFLMRSNLNAGVRYALPLVPLLIVVAAAGLGTMLRETKAWTVRAGRLVFVLLLVQAMSVLAAYPHFLAYGNALAGGSAELHRSLLDSNLDWGQGLLELKAFMADEGVASVSLSYFGSAPPDAYGIEYVGLPSFLPMAPDRTAAAEASPRFTVISVNNLYGLYLDGADPFAAYRTREPYAVLGHSMFVFDERAGAE